MTPDRKSRPLPVLLIGACVLGFATEAASLRDGKRFDPAATYTQRAEGAPEALDRLAFLLGDWDVQQELFAADTVAFTARGRARITYMNRGHGLMERFHTSDFDGKGHALSTMAFIVYNAAGSVWGLSEANSFQENIRLWSGDFQADALVLRDAGRRGGSLALTHERRTIERQGQERILVRLEQSTDDRITWQTTLVRSYTRASAPADLFETVSRFGEPAPGLPAEARQFDFLIGEWDESHDMTFPDGRNVQFPVNGTAVHALDGHAIMEFSWYDVDPRLPDAATTILRLYNRHMRRWECMYVTNRFNSILYFGGVREGDKIVLHMFDAHSGSVPYSHWTFDDMESEGYTWYANTTSDRGETFRKTWIIEARRKASDPGGAAQSAGRGGN